MADETTDNNSKPEAPTGEENRKSLVAFLKSIKFRRSGKREEVAECAGHFAGLQAKVKRRRTRDETLAIRSAN
ncbi:MAG TPA: hypothetical protein VJ947_09240 [Pseudohaliea sp.]|nr:hypothetical protein [Pseudohaliea sp.]